MTQIDLNKYADFVDAVTSDESKESKALDRAYRKLTTRAIVPRLLTASIGEIILKKYRFKLLMILKVIRFFQLPQRIKI